MDAVQNGQPFTVTRDGHQIGELITPAAPTPVRQPSGVRSDVARSAGS
jgi:hypothetical protein